MKFVDIKNDVAFRKIFGNENKKEILISFLNAVLKLEGEHKIVSVDILSPFQLPELRKGKATIVDLKATDQRKCVYLIEMQVAKDGDLNKWVLYYASQCYTSQIEKGDPFENLNPVFFIGILDFNATKNTNYLSRHKVLDTATGEQLIKDIEFNFIELPKFQKSASELTSIIEQWVYFIKHAKNLKLIPEGVTDPGLKSAYLGAEKHNWNKEELEAYDSVLLRMQRDREGRALDIKIAVKEAVAEKEKEKVMALAEKEEEKIKALAEKEEEKIKALAEKEKEKEEEKIKALAEKEKEKEEEKVKALAEKEKEKEEEKVKALAEKEKEKEEEKVKALAEKEEDMALKFLDLGVSMENISKATGLTIEKIEELKKRMT